MTFHKRALNTLRKNFYTILVALLFLGGTIVRFYDYPNRLIFGPEQGMSLITSASNLEKFSFLGETNLIRSTSASHILFHGAVYSYLILPLLLLFKFQVFPFTVCFAFLNLLTAFASFKLIQKWTNKTIAIFSLFYFLFSDVMIHHSLFAWIVNPTPIIAVISIWLLSIIYKNKKTLIPQLIIGILSGVAFGMQNLYLPFSFALFLFIIIFSKRKLLSTISFIVGVLIGCLPTVIFDIRHDFYHVRTYWQFFLDSLEGKAATTTTYYNYLFLYPIFFFIYGLLTFIIFRIYKPLIIIPLAIFLYINLNSPFARLTFGKPLITDIPLDKLEWVAKKIAADKPPEKFNIAVLLDFDTRAHPLRYLLTFVHKLKPQGVEIYKDIDVLYVLSPKDYDIKSPKVWELQVFLPYQVTLLDSPTPNHRLYKLTK